VNDWLRLYLVLDPDACAGDPVRIAIAAIESGATCIQLRWKTSTDRELLALATELAAVCREASLPFLVNDRIDVALAAGADGAHLGVDDMPVDVAWRLGGPGFIVGYSPETDDQARAALRTGVTYLGIGPFAATATKPDAGKPLGAAEFRRRRELTHLPVVAIGGIGPHNVREAMEAGADGIAVASAITKARDPGAETRALLAAIPARS
jgi:thiamine-phosphate pyrophosphorylase